MSGWLKPYETVGLAQNQEQAALKRKLLIIGAGGHACVVADLAELCGYSDIGFVSDDPPAHSVVQFWTLAGGNRDLSSLRRKYDDAIVAIGNNSTRMKCHYELKSIGFNVPVLIHPSAAVSKRTTIGAGTVLMAQTVVNIGSTIDEAVIVNTGCTVDHDCHIGGAAHISPGASLAGSVSVGARSWVGIGATVRNNIPIGRDCLIGAGAVVVNQVTDGQTVYGNPARLKKIP